jgi:hypothetical protein
MPGYAVIGTPAHQVETPLWRWLAQAPAPASVFELHAATDAHPNAIQHRLDRWVRAGFVTRLEGRPKRYAMNDDAPRTPEPPRVAIDGRVSPRTRTVRDRLWSVMRVLRDFDLPTLIIAADSSRRSAEDLVNCLLRAGYLRRLSCGNRMKGTWSTYRLLRNTGPRTPSVSHGLVDGRRRREVVDHNTGRRIDIAPGAVRLRSKASDALLDGGVS